MNATSKTGGRGGPAVVGPFVQEQIVTRLRQALELARGDLARDVEPVRDLLAEALERVEAAALPLTCAGGALQPAARLTVAALGRAGGEPVSEFLLIPFGEVTVERPVAGESFVFARAHAESAKRWFDRMGRKLAIDYEHQSFEALNTRSDGLRPAAGWIGGLEVRDDGLWAVNVTWTERARTLLGSGEYRYFSPVILWTDEDRTDVAALGPVALTNDPAMHGVTALAASRQSADTEEALDAASGALADEAGRPGVSDSGSERSDSRSESSDLTSEIPDFGSRISEPTEQASVVARSELDAAHAEIALLRQKLAAQEADAFVERGLQLGKILDSTRGDWRADYLRDAQATEARLARAPVLLPPGRVLTLDRAGGVPRWPQSIERATGSHRCGPTRVEPEDLAAYEQALAVGRIVTHGHPRRRATGS